MLDVVVVAELLAAELAQDAVARWGIQKRQNLDQNSKKTEFWSRFFFRYTVKKG